MRKKKLQAGEITVGFTISVLLGLTLFSLASQYLLVKKQVKKTKAAGTVASLSCIQNINDKQYLFFKDNNPVCKREEIGQGTYAWLVGDGPCSVGSPQTCRPPQGFESGEKWCYYFDNLSRNSRCMVRDVSCDNASCFGSSASSSGSGSGSEGGSGGGATGNIFGSGVSNGCFSLKAEFEAKDEGDKKAFYAWVTFESNRGGDVKLEEAGQHVAGWNRFTGGSFTYDPNWSQHWRPGSWIAVGTLTKGQSYTVYYRGILSGCNPQDVSLSCNLTHNNNGSASVSGNGCFCRNCGGGSTPPSSVTSTPTSKPGSPPPNTPPTNTPTPTPIPVDECEKAGGECVENRGDCNKTIINLSKAVNYCQSQYGKSAVCCQIQELGPGGGRRPPGYDGWTPPKICQIKPIKWLNEEDNELSKRDINFITKNDLFIYIGGNENCANAKIETINFLKDNQSLNKQLKNSLFLKKNCLQNDDYCIKESVKNIITEGGNYQFQFSFNNQTETSPILEVTGSIEPSCSISPNENILNDGKYHCVNKNKRAKCDNSQVVEEDCGEGLVCDEEKGTEAKCVAPTPEIVAEPKCDVNDPNYCIDSEGIYDNNDQQRQCQLPNGSWVNLVEVRKFEEDCSGQAMGFKVIRMAIPGLRGKRTVIRAKKGGSANDKNNCVRKIENSQGQLCEDIPGIEDKCDLYCDLRPTYSIKIIFKQSFFEKFFPASNYESGTQFAFLGSENFFERDLTKAPPITFSADYKKHGYIYEITDIAPKTIIDFFSWEPTGIFMYWQYKIKIVVQRVASGVTEIIEIKPVWLSLNRDDLSIVIQ